MSLSSYNPALEDRIRNFVRTEEPTTVPAIARHFRDLDFWDVDAVVCEMVRDGLLRRIWDGDPFQSRFAEERFELR